MKMLAFRMGEIYANVTEMMLSGEVSEAFEDNARDEGLIFQPDLFVGCCHPVFTTLHCLRLYTFKYIVTNNSHSRV